MLYAPPSSSCNSVTGYVFAANLATCKQYTTQVRFRVNLKKKIFPWSRSGSYKEEVGGPVQVIITHPPFEQSDGFVKTLTEGWPRCLETLRQTLQPTVTVTAENFHPGLDHIEIRSLAKAWGLRRGIESRYGGKISVQDLRNIRFEG